MSLEILTPARPDSALRNKCAIGIVIKTPQNGFSKTRLTPPLSSEEAAKISGCFLKDTSAAIEELSRENPFVAGVAIYTPTGSEGSLGELLPPGFKMIAQRDGDLGARLSGATEDLFAVGFSAVCLIGSDSPTLPIRYLRDVSDLLKERGDRMVIGPCDDGGYYLIGLRQPHSRLFEEITWSAERVCSETLARSNEIHLPAVILPAWYDVDDRFSLNRLLSELFPERAHEEVPQGASAPHTKEFLREILANEGQGRIWSQASFPARTV
jgi:rSAM/selenodomain-associated transferase 1